MIRHSDMCEISELPTYACADCIAQTHGVGARVNPDPLTGDLPQTPDAGPPTLVVMVAKYDGKCRACEEKITGDQDVIVSDYNGWIHVECSSVQGN